MNHRAAIIGDGQMALVLADALNQRGVGTTVWCPFQKQVEPLRQTRQSRRLPGFTLDSAVDVTGDEQTVFDGVTVVINAIPTQFIRPVWQRLSPHVPENMAVVSVSKGIENTTLMRPSQIIADVVPAEHSMCTLSGPTIAAELARRLPAAMVAASDRMDLAELVQDLLNVSWLRIYANDDQLGVEVAGATKNVIALAAGMVDGLDAGDNLKSALLARGLAEIARLGAAMGAKVDTFFGIAGVGDLATTCFSPEGRNRSCGELLGKGKALKEILAESSSIVEGVPTTQSVVELARQYEVEMPITQAVHAILFESLKPSDAIASLMSREMKPEQIG